MARSPRFETGGTLPLRSGLSANFEFDRHQSPLDDFYADRGRALAVARRSLSPDQFKSVLYAKGWSMRALADYWGVTPEYVRKLAGAEKRAQWWDDAVLGLPTIGPRIKRHWSWSGEPEAWSPLAGLDQEGGGAAGTGQIAEVKRPKRPNGTGFRYWGYMVVGAVVAVARHLGEMADEGMHGVVVQVIRERTQERYRVLFETGGVEMFSPDLVDDYLVTTGLERDGLAGYVWRGEEAVRHDYLAGMFVFDGVEG